MSEENMTMKGGDLKHTKSQLFLKTPQDRCFSRVIFYLSPSYIRITLEGANLLVVLLIKCSPVVRSMVYA